MLTGNYQKLKVNTWLETVNGEMIPGPWFVIMCTSHRFRASWRTNLYFEGKYWKELIMHW